MPILPPVEKLPLAVRKNVRDNFENSKEESEKQISQNLGADWKIIINPLAVWPYATEDYAKERLGQCIQSYVDGAIYQLKYFVDSFGDEIKQELNSIAYKHELDLRYDDKKTYSYTGPAIIDGVLVILFSQDKLGTNTNDGLEKSNLHKALNAAPPPPSENGAAPALSFAARTSIKRDWDPKVEELTSKFKEMLKIDIKLNPNFESNFAILKKNAGVKAVGLREDWEARIGSFFLSYFEGLHYQMEWKKFGEDDMLQEGFEEAVPKHEIQLLIVEKLETGKSNYNECVIKDGVFTLQTQPKTWDSNINDAGQYIIETL